MGVSSDNPLNIEAIKIVVDKAIYCQDREYEISGLRQVITEYTKEMEVKNDL